MQKGRSGDLSKNLDDLHNELVNMYIDLFAEEMNILD